MSTGDTPDPSAEGSAITDPFVAIVGADHARAGGAGDAVDGRVPESVVRPGGVDEIAAVLRTATAYGLAVVPTGLGRHLDVGGTPDRLDVLLRLDRLDAIEDHHAADMTVTVGAGCTIAALETVLATAGQWLPIDPPDPARTTVGGLIAANLSGPLRASQGTVRDLLLGLTLVDAEGATIRGGGRVVKNVAGYDLPKLHVGALGSLGVIASATFKVRPRPAIERAVVVECATGRDAGEVALALRDAVEPLWLDIGVSDAVRTPIVVAGVGGSEAEVGDAIERLLAAARRLDRRAHGVEAGAARRAVAGALGAASGAVTLRIATLPTDVGEVLDAVLDCARDRRCPVRAGAHATSGVTRAVWTNAADAAAAVTALRPRVEAAGGSVVVERATPAAKERLATEPGLWGAPAGGAELARALKEALDPARTLSPGRLPGGV